jgi:hypothetical protein
LINNLEDGSLGQVSQEFNRIYTRPDKDKPAIAEIVQRALQEASKCPPDSQFFVTGHSLGGALSTLATLHIATHTNFKKPILYTFASPRVGDPKFADHFANLECFRVANSENIVTTVPPATGQLIGEEMLMEMNDKQKNTAKSIGLIASHFTHNLSVQVDEHIEEPIYFTAQRGAISLNHNMFKTYREALPK